MIYLNIVELEKQIHGFVRKSVIIEEGLTGSRGLERVEGRLDESKSLRCLRVLDLRTRKAQKWVWIRRRNRKMVERGLMGINALF